MFIFKTSLNLNPNRDISIFESVKETKDLFTFSSKLLADNF